MVFCFHALTVFIVLPKSCCSVLVFCLGVFEGLVEVALVVWSDDGFGESVKTDLFWDS